METPIDLYPYDRIRDYLAQRWQVVASDGTGKALNGNGLGEYQVVDKTAAEPVTWQGSCLEEGVARFKALVNGTPVLVHKRPEPGSAWFNNRRQKLYTVVGAVSHCEGVDWDVLYRSEDMEPGYYRYRSTRSWYGTNRHGNPRFVPYAAPMTEEEAWQGLEAAGKPLVEVLEEAGLLDDAEDEQGWLDPKPLP